MSIRRTIFSFGVVLLCFQGCTGAEVKTDFDPAVDFSKFLTFAFMGVMDVNKGGVMDNSLTRKRIEPVVARELMKKGLLQVEPDQHPDLAVYYWLGVQNKQRVEANQPVGVYNWRRGHVGGPAYGSVTTYDYKEGTLILDLVEPAKKELVWRATMVANLADTTEENIELGDKAIRKAFEQYPPPDGRKKTGTP